jgi:hypothetical protein
MSFMNFAGKFPPSREEIHKLLRLARSPSSHAPSWKEWSCPRTPEVLELDPAISECVAAICQAPEEDEPRYRYAEVVQPLDPPRADLIRKQLADPTDPIIAQLLYVHSERWREEWRFCSAEDLVYHRGMVEEMSLAGRAWITFASVICSRTPLKRLRLVAVRPLLAEALQVPEIRGLQKLDLRGNRLGDAGTRVLAQASALEQLFYLNLAGNNLTDLAIQELQQTTWFQTVQFLDLRDNKLSDTFRVALASPRILV